MTLDALLVIGSYGVAPKRYDEEFATSDETLAGDMPPTVGSP